MNLPKLDVRGSIKIAVSLVTASAAILFGGFYVSDKLQAKKTELETSYNNMEMVNIEALEAQKIKLSAQNSELSESVQSIKEETVTQFDKDVFSTAISTFADLNSMAITKLQQDPVELQEDGFYSVSYNISLSGSIYGMMEFMNLVNTMGYQTTIEYFSFRQNGTYKWLERSTDKEDLLTWIEEVKLTKEDTKLEEMKKLSLKIQNDNYDYGDEDISYVAAPTVEPTIIDPLDNFISSLLQMGNNVTSSTTSSSGTTSNVITPTEKEEKREKALAQKESDRATIQKYLEENYPEGTMFKDGQLIIPALDGSMVFDLGITFTGNDDGVEISDDYLALLLPSSVTTSKDKTITAIFDGKKVKIPSVIEGVDVSALDGINISNTSKFTVSWNNNRLTKDVVEQCLALKEDGGKMELHRASAEIRFLQKNGKTDLEIMKYLIFLYHYQIEP